MAAQVGAIYAKTYTAVADTKFRMETTSTVLKHAYITIADNDLDVGDVTTQPVTKATGAAFELKDFDLSELYFINTVGGSNGTVNIVGVKAK